MITITPTSLRLYYALPVNQQRTRVLVGVLTSVICDILEMAVLATTCIANSDTARAIILHRILSPMTVANGIGMVAKTDVNWTIIGELIRELMLVIGRFLAVINLHPSWQLWTKPVDPESENQLTTEEEIIVRGLDWHCCVVGRG